VTVDWPSYTVGELQETGALLVEDGNHGEYRPRPIEYEPDGTPFIRATDMADGRLLFDSAPKINDVALQRIHKGIGMPNDIIFSHKGTVGKLAMAPADAPAFVCSPQTTFWRIQDTHRLDKRYLMTFMRSRAFID
jgi:type I restriction enzyme, S subunit